MKTVLRRFVIGLALAMPASPAIAVEEFSAIWSGISLSDEIERGTAPARWSYWLDVQARYVEPGSGARQYLARPGFFFDLNDRVTLGAGYARGYLHNASDQRARENRFWQQVTFSWPDFVGGRGSLRLRVEERELDLADDWRHRGRLQLKYTRPLQRHARTQLVFSSEAMFDLNDSDWGGDTGLSEHRGYAGVEVELDPAWSVEVGYLNQYVFAETGVDLMSHAAVLQLKYRP